MWLAQGHTAMSSRAKTKPQALFGAISQQALLLYGFFPLLHTLINFLFPDVEQQILLVALPL